MSESLISRVRSATAQFLPSFFATSAGWFGSSIYHGYYAAVPAHIGLMLIVVVLAILIAKGRDGA